MEQTDTVFHHKKITVRHRPQEIGTVEREKRRGSSMSRRLGIVHTLSSRPPCSERLASQHLCQSSIFGVSAWVSVFLTEKKKKKKQRQELGVGQGMTMLQAVIKNREEGIWFSQTLLDKTTLAQKDCSNYLHSIKWNHLKSLINWHHVLHVITKIP